MSPQERTDVGRQKTLGEDFEPIKNRKVTTKANKYSKALSERMAWQEQENVARQELIDVMQSEEVPVVQIDGYRLELVQGKTRIKRTCLDNGEDQGG